MTSKAFGKHSAGQSNWNLKEIMWHWNIFNVCGSKFTLPCLPVRGVKDVQQALQHVPFPPQFTRSTPNFLPLMLEREVFDKVSREWKMYYDRV